MILTVVYEVLRDEEGGGMRILGPGTEIHRNLCRAQCPAFKLTPRSREVIQLQQEVPPLQRAPKGAAGSAQANPTPTEMHGGTPSPPQRMAWTTKVEPLPAPGTQR
eukprot:6688990-Pyramimonas_sp.AAC.1